MSDRFLAYLPMPTLARTTAEALVERIGALYPRIPVDVRPVRSDAGGVRAGGGLLLAVDNTVLMVIPVARKLPREAYETALDSDRVWPEAAATMAGHGAHLIVGTVAEPQTHGEALEAAGAMTLACAALATLLPVSAAVWTNAATIARPEHLRGAGQAVASAKAPLGLWIGLRFLDGPPAPDGARRFAVLTSGLLPFVGREIEWMPSAALPPALIAERVLGTCQYLMAQGMVLADGETLGASADERIRVRLADRGRRPGIPVVQLTPEEMEPASAGAGRARTGG